MSDSLDLAEAFWRLGWLTATSARSAALDALAEGYDTPALYELLGGGFGTAAEVHDLFSRLLAELDRAPLAHGEAAIRFARVAAQEIASGSLTPVATMGANWRELWESPDLPEVLCPLVRLAVRYDFYTSAPDLLPDYPTEITEVAQAFLAATP